MRFSAALQAQFEDLIEDKLKELATKGSAPLSTYIHDLKRKGMDLVFTSVSRNEEGFDLNSFEIVDTITDEVIDMISNEVEAILGIIDNGPKNRLIKQYKTKGKARGVGTNEGGALRDSSGRFIGALKLATLLNVFINIYASDIMKNLSHGNILKYRTGRLANSGAVTTVNLDTKSIYFTYMLAPYEVFQPGGKLFKSGRDPRNIFGNAIAMALSKILSKKDMANSSFRLFNQRSVHGNVSGGYFTERNT